MMEDEEEDENAFELVPPDKYTQNHLLVHIKFFLGGKSPEYIGPVDLSKNHQVKDVIKHVLTLYRKNKDLKTKVQLEFADVPEAYELRHVEDDSDDSDEQDGVFYKPSMELPPLELKQEIGEFEALVLCISKNWKQKQSKKKDY